MVEFQFVVLEVAGSSPVVLPIVHVVMFVGGPKLNVLNKNSS